MNSIRKWIRDLFGFSGNEINGFLILLPLMVALVFSEPLYHAWTASREQQFTEDNRTLDSLIAGWGPQERKSGIMPVVEENSLFPFDPNTARVEELRKLGFSENSANRIAAYRMKGGVFRIKSDILKIYGLDSTLYRQLYNYIRLPSRRVFPLDLDKPYSGPKFEPLEKKAVDKTFDINTADTTLLKTVYGIGSVLAARIIKFRQGLGGFVTPTQLDEVYGLDSMVIKRLLKVGFIEADFIPERININTSEESVLSRHPYIRNKMARALVSYRFQHGDFIEVSDIKKLSVIQNEEFERLLPYLKVKD